MTFEDELIAGGAVPTDEWEVRSDPKPPARIVDKTVIPAGPTRCVVTGATEGLTRFHLISRAQGGSDVPENMVWVEAFTHDGFHAGSPLQRYEIGHAVRIALGSEHLDYITAHPRGGWEWLEKHFPAEQW